MAFLYIKFRFKTHLTCKRSVKLRIKKLTLDCRQKKRDSTFAESLFKNYRNKIYSSKCAFSTLFLSAFEIVSTNTGVAINNDE